MISHFQGVDLGCIIMGLHWAQGVKGGYVKGAKQCPLTELGLDVLGNVADVCGVLLVVGEGGHGCMGRRIVQWDAELDMVQEHCVGLGCQGDAPLTHVEGG